MALTKVKLISDGVITVDNLHENHGITTTHIGEGDKLFYTDARVQSYLSANDYATIDGGYFTNATLSANILTFDKSDGTTDSVDLSLYLDDTNLARVVSGTLDALTGVATFIREDLTTFTVDFSAFLSDANDYVSSGSFNTSTGVLTLTRLGGATVTVDLDGKYAEASHTHIWTDITDRPTALSSFTNDLGNYGGFLTSYTETDTLATVTGRGSTTSSTLNLEGRVNIGNGLSRPDALNSDAVSHARIGGADVHLYVASLGAAGGYKVAVQAARTSDFLSFDLDLQSNGGVLRYGGNEVATKTWTSSQNYLTSYSETDTLATVTARGASTSSDLTFNGIVTMGTSGTQYIRMGRFPSSVTNSGEAWIGRASDRLTGSMTVQLGSAADRTFEVVDHAWSVVTFNVNGSGVANASGSFRAPVFYDSNNTAFYADPSSISNLYGLAIRGDVDSTAGGNQIFFWGSGNTTTSAIGFKANGGSFTNPTGAGDGYNTYLTMDSNGRGWVFRRSEDGTFGNVYTSGWILNNGLWQANSSMRAPIFYDSDNTGYYLNPAGTSVVDEIRIGTSGNAASWHKITVETGGFLGRSGSRGVGSYASASTTEIFAYDYSIAQYIPLQLQGSYVSSINSHRAPIFYDSADTSFYLDPNGVSKLGFASFEGDGNAYNARTTTGVSIGRYAGEYSFIELGATNINGSWIDFSLANGTDYGGRIRYNHSASEFRFDTGGATQLYLNSDYLYHQSDMRAPIFYDSNNTGYYTDPASTSVMNAVDATTLYGDDVYTTGGWFRNHANNNGVYWSNTGWHLYPNNANDFLMRSGSNEATIQFLRSDGTTMGYVHNASDYTLGFLTTSRSWRFRVDNSGNSYATTSSRAPIFYDSDNTGYYLDPAGTSNLATLNIEASNSIVMYKSQTVDMSGAAYSTSNYYPVVISVPTDGALIEIQNNLNSNAPSFSTHGSGFTLNLRWWVNGSGWGTTEVKRKVYQWHERFTNSRICGGITQMGTSSQEVVYLRGGGVYYFRFSKNLGATPYSSNYTNPYNTEVANVTSSPINDVWNAASGTETYYAGDIYASNMQSYVYYDRDNTSYYINGYGTSYLLGLVVNSSLDCYGTMVAHSNLYCSGDITASGDVTAFSDQSVKENIRPIENPLDKVKSINGVVYTRTDLEDKSEKVGFIAQEIIKVLPEVVTENEDGKLSVAYGNITALLIEAIKEQQKQIDELKAIINGTT